MKEGDGSGMFNGIYNLRANAGYVGDVYGTNNRAREFAANIGHGDYKEGIKILKEQAYRHDVYILEHRGAEFLLNKTPIPDEVWEERGKIVRNFVNSIESGRNEYEEYEKVNVQFAETGEYGNE